MVARRRAATGSGRAVGFAVALCVGGCSLLVDGPSPGGDATNSDGGGIDAIVGDGYAITAILPAGIDEGMGYRLDAIDKPAAMHVPVPIAIQGTGLDGAEVVLSWPLSPALVQGPVASSPDGTLLATSVAVPVTENLSAGATETITVTVTKNTSSFDGFILVTGLNEVDLRDAVSGETYSAIVQTGTVRFGGVAPIRLVATSHIELVSPVDVSGIAGADGGAGPPAAGGPGGGDSGGGTQPGGVGVRCVDIGMGSGGGGGGGGGGHIGAGTTGEGSPCPNQFPNDEGEGGASYGDPRLVPLTDHGGSGGGAGGASGSGNSGGGGGGGGGVLELTSLGRIAVRPGTRISAWGGDGGAGASAGTSEAGGGGGGGSGGSVLIRAHSLSIDPGAQIDIAGGAGGAGTNAEGFGLGGAGSAGRARLDAPGATLPGYRGPATSDLPAVTSSPVITVAGDEPEYRVTVDGVFLSSPVTSGQPTMLPLQPKLSEVCLFVTALPGPSDDLSEAKNCYSVVFVPAQ